jgi:hypothetical protein
MPSVTPLRDEREIKEIDVIRRSIEYIYKAKSYTAHRVLGLPSIYAYKNFISTGSFRNKNTQNLNPLLRNGGGYGFPISDACATHLGWCAIYQEWHPLE